MPKRLCVILIAALLISACDSGEPATHTPIQVTATPETPATRLPPTLWQAQDKAATATSTPAPSPTPTRVPPTLRQAQDKAATAPPTLSPTATNAPPTEPSPPGSWWRESTPQEQGLDPQIIARAYQQADDIRTLYGLLVVKNGYLVAERYFNGRTVYSANVTASVTKSFTSALIGLALREDNLLASLDQKMLDFFPEYDVPDLDPGKRDVTVRHLLQMRAGYPFDSTDDFFDQLVRSGNWLRFIIRDYDLVHAPGSQNAYSNASAHALAGILAKAVDGSVMDFATQHLFGPLDITVRAWPKDPQGYYAGHGDIRLRPRDLAKLGYLYLNDGVVDGKQIIPAEWVTESFQAYSLSPYGSLDYFRNIRYGYLWWIADVGSHQVYFAWGHGGQYIVIVPDLDMVVVSAADAFVGDFSQDSWEMEKGIMDLIGELVASIDEG